MTTDDSQISAMRVYSALLGSLAPWLALLVAATLADDQIHAGGLLSAAPLYYAFVGLPSLAAIVAGHSALTRLAVTAAMTSVAVYAGVQMATIDDGQAGLAVLLVPMAAFPLAGVVWVGGAVFRRWRAGGQEPPAGPARTSDRLAALLVDVVVVTVALAAPVTMLSNAKAEVAAAVIGVALATVYLAAFVSLAGRTPGQALLGLTMVDNATGESVAAGRALLRSLVVVVEVVGASWMLLAPVALAELAAVVMSGRSLTDRLFGTAVVASGWPPPAGGHPGSQEPQVPKPSGRWRLP